MKKKIIIAIILIILVIIGGVGYLIIKDFQQEDKLKAELDEITKIANFEDRNIDEIEKRLKTTVTNGDYAIVEKAYKKYLSEFYNNTMEMAKILNDENISKSLTVENYKEDGPDFKRTKEYIAKTNENLEKCKTTYYELLTEEKAMSYINGKGLDDYYIDFYKQEIVGNIEEEQKDRTVEKSINEVIELLNNSKNVIDFLSENKGKWQIEGENIVFNNNTLSNKYKELLDKVV